MAGLDLKDLDPDPFVQFARWFEAARTAGQPYPDAMVLATAARDGTPSARMVILRGVDERGFVFYTNYESRKGRELDANPQAALVFYWPRLERQVCITGEVGRVSKKESDAYFRTRPLDAQLSAWASRQSEVIPSRGVLEQRVAELAARYGGRQVPLPPYWGGLRLKPASIEFWQGRPGRLHDRLRYTRRRGHTWRIERLSP